MERGGRTAGEGQPDGNGRFHQKGCKRTARPDEPAGTANQGLKDYRTVIVPYLEQLRQVKYLCRYDIYREPTDKEVMAAYRRKGLDGMYTRYEYWKLLQLLKDSQEKEAVARKAYEESLSMKRPWVLAGNTLAKLYLEKDVTDTRILEPLIDRTIFTVNYKRKNMDTGRTEIINPIEVVVNQLCMYIKAGDFENASVMAKLIPADYKEFDLVKAYAWAMGGYFQEGIRLKRRSEPQRPSAPSASRPYRTRR